MKITNGAMLDVIMVLNKFANVGGKLGYAIARTKRLITDNLSDFNTLKDELVVKYGQQNDQGNYYVDPQSENYADFIREITPLLDISVDIDIYKVPKDEFDLPYCEGATVADYDLISTLFTETKKSE